MRRGRSGSFELGGSEVESDENGRSWSGGETEGQDSEVLLSGWQRDSALSWSRFRKSRVLQWLRSWWRVLVSVLTPLLLLPLPLAWNSTASRSLYVILIIAVYWMTEVIPISCTSLLPLVLFPALGVLSADDTARNYLKDINMLFVGGLMMAVAVERWNLHKRLALLMLMAVGSKPSVRLLFGFMGITGFLSMWISNTATAAMMLPIAQAVLLQLDEDKTSEDTGTLSESPRDHQTVLDDTPVGDGTLTKCTEEETKIGDYESLDEEKKNGRESHGNGGSRYSVASSETSGSVATDCVAGGKSVQRLAKALMLGVAYAANIGGTGTLTGTGPNIVLGGLAGDLGINFGLWFVFALPPMLVALLVAWLYLSLVYCDDCFQSLKRKFFKQKISHYSGTKSKGIIRQEYKKLGRMSYAEVLVLVMFVVLVFLWLFREPKFIPGWGDWFRSEDGKSYVSDATAAVAVVFLLFLIPSQPCCCSWSNVLKAGRSPRLLDWDAIQKNLPWNVIFILGSGFAIAQAAEESGLSDWFSSKLNVFHSVPPFIIAFLVSVIVAMVTEFISNVATTTLFLPILRSLAVSLCVHPLYFMIPATVSASYAFMFPVATPPNAVAFSYGYLRVHNMVLTGFVMNIVCVLIVTVALNVIALPLFQLHTFPLDVINSTDCGANDTLSGYS